MAVKTKNKRINKRINKERKVVYRQSTVTKQYKFGTSASWEDNRRSGVALAMCHRQ